MSSSPTDGRTGRTGRTDRDAARAVFQGEGELAGLCRALDWAATPLGPVAGWSCALRTLAGLVVASPDALVLLWGPELVQVYSDAMRPIMGARHPSALGAPALATWPETVDVQKPIHDAVLLRGESLSFANQRFELLRNGYREWAEFTVSYAPVRDDDGAIRGILGTGIETTGVRRAEQALRQANALIQGITDGTDDLIAALDDNFRFTFFNAAYAREFRTLWDVDVAIGMNLVDALAPWPAEQQKAQQLWARALAGESFSVTMEFGPVDTITQVYDLRFHPVTGPDGEFLGAAHILRNVTEQVRTQDALRERERSARRLADELARERGKLAAVIDDLPVGVVIADAQGQLLSFNRSALALHGYADDDAMPRVPDEYLDVFELGTLDGRMLQRHEWPVAVALTGEVVRGRELRLRNRLRNIERIVVFDVVPLRDAAGAIDLLVFTLQDLTERRLTEEALRLSEQRYALAARATDDAIWDWQLDENLIIWNEGLARVFGYDVAATSPEWWYDAIHPDDRDRVIGSIRAVIEGTDGCTGWTEEYRLRRADGSYALVMDRGYVARDADARALRMVGVMADITRQRQVEQERERLFAAEKEAREAAEASSRVKTQFLSVISHELRTPLTAVLGYSDLLDAGVAGPINERQREFIARIRSSTTHLVTIIDEILTFSRAEAGREDVRLGKEDVAGIARTVVGMLAHEANARGLALSLHGAEHPLVAVTDGGKVSQILVNLVGNAVKYTDEGSIDVELQASDGVLELRVSDTGPGIPLDRQDDVFEPFVQVDQSNTRSRGGTGLGLAICRRLAQLLGGDVTLHSEPGHGSTFTVRLPRRSTSTNDQPQR